MLKIHSAKESQLIHWRRITTYIQYSVNQAHFTRICLQKNLIQVHIKRLQLLICLETKQEKQTLNSNQHNNVHLYKF